MFTLTFGSIMEKLYIPKDTDCNENHKRRNIFDELADKTQKGFGGSRYKGSCQYAPNGAQPIGFVVLRKRNPTINHIIILHEINNTFLLPYILLSIRDRG